MKSVLELSNTEAKQFFLKQESYCGIDLPKYFVFGELLKEIHKEINNNLNEELKKG